MKGIKRRHPCTNKKNRIHFALTCVLTHNGIILFPYLYVKTSKVNYLFGLTYFNFQFVSCECVFFPFSVYLLFLYRSFNLNFHIIKQIIPYGKMPKVISKLFCSQKRVKLHSKVYACVWDFVKTHIFYSNGVYLLVIFFLSLGAWNGNIKFVTSRT